ncbi:DsbA family protein [Actinophytocola glycyrrhizae]|uniref:DsbA family protein n=1 Tax=Actinophytocola glycyrrhizae TaxID=2044873 RepID=A0ABV9RWI3_9PSEU
MRSPRQTMSRRARTAIRRAPGDGVGRATIAMIVVVLLIATTVIGGVLWRADQKQSATKGPIPAVTSAPDDLLVGFEPSTVSVLVGPAEAPTTIHVYEDFLCPACRRFEHRYGERLHDAVERGEVKVAYHLVNLLDNRSDPPGYSLRAANAALAVAVHSAPHFPDFHRSLFAAQPDQGSRGYSDNQLVGLAERLGAVGPELTDAITNGAKTDEIERALREARNDPALRRTTSDGRSYFAVPTVTVNGRLVEDIQRGWLDPISPA